MIIYLTGVSIALICIFFVAKNVEYFFMCLLAICTSCENYLINLPIYWLDYLFLDV
jgi:hypothetical protein